MLTVGQAKKKGVVFVEGDGVRNKSDHKLEPCDLKGINESNSLDHYQVTSFTQRRHTGDEMPCDGNLPVIVYLRIAGERRGCNAGKFDWLGVRIAGAITSWKPNIEALADEVRSHKHAEMIKAKADNMDLVRFTKLDDNEGCEWAIQADAVQKSTQFSESSEYFLCLPKHKEVCLHWLNGGDVIVRDYPEDERERVLLAGGCSNWHDASVFMCERAGIRIKPKKEKRWIAVTRHNCIDKLFDNKSQAEEFATGFYPNNHISDFQFIEIEIEV